MFNTIITILNIISGINHNEFNPKDTLIEQGLAYSDEEAELVINDLMIINNWSYEKTINVIKSGVDVSEYL